MPSDSSGSQLNSTRSYSPQPGVGRSRGQSERWFDHRRLLIALVGTAAALVLAYLAQRFYDGLSGGFVSELFFERLHLAATQANRLNLGSALYVLGMILFAITALPLPDWKNYITAPPPQTPRPRRTGGPHRPDARILRPIHAPSEIAPPSSPAPAPAHARIQAGILVAALIAYALSILLFVLRGEDAWVRWLWAAALLIFAASVVAWPLWKHESAENAEHSPRFRWHNVVVLIVIVAGGFWLRFYRVADLPGDVHGDMASYGLQALDMIGGANPYLFREGWANIPMLGFVPASLAMRLFGETLFGLNITSVIGGVLSLLASYLLAWRLFDSHRLAALATTILAVNTAHIHFSRIAAYMDPWPFVLFGMFCLVDGLRARRNASLAAAGLLLGLGFQMYFSGRVSIVFLLIAFAYLLIFQRRLITSNGRGLILLMIGGIIALGPSLIYFAGNAEAFSARSREVFLFHPPVLEHLRGKYGVTSATAVILEQMRRSLLMFNHSLDSSTQFGYARPMFSSLLSPLVVLGFGYSLRWWRRPQVALTLIWLLSILVAGSVLTNNAPFWPRLVGILPAAAILAALVIDRVWENLWQLGGRSQLVALLLLGLVTVFLGYVGWQNWTLYEQIVRDNARPQARVGRYLASLPPQFAACSFGAPDALNVRETRFQAWPRPVVDFPPNAVTAALTACPGPPLVWIVGPNQTEQIAQVQSLWPDGIVEEHFDQNGALVFISYLVSAGETSPGLVPPAPRSEPAPQSGAAPTSDQDGFVPTLADGSAFEPEQEFYGSTSGGVYEIAAGSIRVQGGTIDLQVGPVPGYDAVYDYVELRGRDGSIIRVEAESPVATSGDIFAPLSGDDGHWWQQDFERFSEQRGLVAQKGEAVPVLTTTIAAPDGEYDAYIGSFSGDPANGVFALAIRWQ